MCVQMVQAPVCRTQVPTPATPVAPLSLKERSLRLAGALGAAVLVAVSPLPAHAAAESAQLFTNTCAGCHAGGSNIVRREATLQLEDLQRYGLDGPDALYTLIYSGKGSMPGYGEGCAPKGACTFGRRLTDDQVRGLADYVLEQAKSGWKE